MSLEKINENIRLNTSLINQAELAGRHFNRKAARQIEHWARIGQALERMYAISACEIIDSLSGKICVDQLNTGEKAIFLVLLHEMEVNAKFPDFGAVKHESGHSYTTLDKQGRVTRVFPNESKEIAD